MPKVSIVIATYNRADLLPATLDSALAQTYRDLEVIVSDNASTDSTPELMEAYIARDARVKYIRRSINEGPIANYHTGLQAATGDYIAFLDSDDLFHPAKIERQIQAFDARPSDVGLVHTCFNYIDGHGRPISRTMMLPEGDLFEGLLRYEAQIWFGSILFRRVCVERTGLLDASVTQAADVDYLLRATRLGYKVGCVQEVLYSHRHHGSNQSTNVAGLAQALFTIYTRIYSDPEIAAKYGTWKDQTFANLHLDCAGRLLSAGQYEQAREHIAQVLSLRPEWERTSRPWIRSLLYEYALGPTCDKPIAFVNGWFDHLPPNAGCLSQFRDLILALAYTGAALRAFYSGDTHSGRDYMTCAVQQSPELLSDPTEFVALMHHFAATLPVDEPDDFVHLVFSQLPSSAKQLQNTESRILSDISIAGAFCAWEAHDPPRAKRRVLSAVRHRPVVALNRGVMSLFVRSVVHSLTL